jgi:hypothetical protein
MIIVLLYKDVWGGDLGGRRKEANFANSETVEVFNHIQDASSQCLEATQITKKLVGHPRETASTRAFPPAGISTGHIGYRVITLIHSGFFFWEGGFITLIITKSDRPFAIFGRRS